MVTSRDFPICCVSRRIWGAIKIPRSCNNTLYPNAYGINFKESLVECGEDECRLPTGIQITKLGAYGYTLRADEVLAGDEAVTVAMNTTEEDPAGQLDCDSMDFHERTPSNLAAMLELSRVITKGMIAQGGQNLDLMIARFQSDQEKFRNAWRNIVIDDGQHPGEEDLRSQVLNMIDTIRVTIGTEAATQVLQRMRTATQPQTMQKSVIQGQNTLMIH